MLFLAEGDANTKFYHLQACHRNRKNRIESLNVHGVQVVTDTAMADAIYDYYVGVLGANFECTRRFDLHSLGLPQEDLLALELLFTEEEVWSFIVDMLNDKAPGPDGLTGLFYEKTWEIIKGDIMNAFNAFWSLDSRSFNHLNDAYMILLKKKEHPGEIRDYRPISLVYSFSKLITKCLAKRLAAHRESEWCAKRTQAIYTGLGQKNALRPVGEVGSVLSCTEVFVVGVTSG
jgi:hypothetical protein